MNNINSARHNFEIKLISWQKTFKKVHYLTEKLGSNNINHYAKKVYKKIKDESININDIKIPTPYEIKTAIKTTNSKKAPGYDKIQNIILKNLPNRAITQLIQICCKKDILIC